MIRSPSRGLSIEDSVVRNPGLLSALLLEAVDAGGHLAWDVKRMLWSYVEPVLSHYSVCEVEEELRPQEIPSVEKTFALAGHELPAYFDGYIACSLPSLACAEQLPGLFEILARVLLDSATGDVYSGVDLRNCSHVWREEQQLWELLPEFSMDDLRTDIVEEIEGEERNRSEVVDVDVEIHNRRAFFTARFQLRTTPPKFETLISTIDDVVNVEQNFAGRFVSGDSDGLRFYRGCFYTKIGEVVWPIDQQATRLPPRTEFKASGRLGFDIALRTDLHAMTSAHVCDASKNLMYPVLGLFRPEDGTPPALFLSDTGLLHDLRNPSVGFQRVYQHGESQSLAEPLFRESSI